MTKVRRVLTATLVLSAFSLARAESWRVEIEPRPQDHFEHVAYQLWMPDGLDRTRALIVLHHGCGVTGGLLHTDDLQYRALATKWHMALLAAAESSGVDCQSWARIERGSADAFLSALQALSVKSKHPEVATVPWALWGHSGGGAWVTAMTARYPERVIATFARSGAFATPNDVIGPGPMTLEVSDAMRRVPIMFCYGIKEEPADSVMTHFIGHLREVYNLGGAKSHWGLAIDPITGHENGDTRYLTFRFFETIFAHTPAVGGSAPPPAWQGDPRSRDIAEAGQPLHQSGDVAISWLPSDPFAHAWQEFELTGKIRDTTPPDPPTVVQARPVAKGTVLNWIANADIESGIKEFRVYGDGQLLGRVASVHGDDVKDDFQSWNYTDRPAPDQEDNVMRFTWVGTPHRLFTVTTVNHWDLESAATAATPSR